MTEFDRQLERTSFPSGQHVDQRSGHVDIQCTFTPRQLDVLRELAKGQSNKQIGKVLKLAPETVHHHLKAIFLKLGVDTREGAVAEGRRRGIIP